MDGPGGVTPGPNIRVWAAALLRQRLLVRPLPGL